MSTMWTDPFLVKRLLAPHTRPLVFIHDLGHVFHHVLFFLHDRGNDVPIILVENAQLNQEMLFQKGHGR